MESSDAGIPENGCESRHRRFFEVRNAYSIINCGSWSSQRQLRKELKFCTRHHSVENWLSGVSKWDDKCLKLVGNTRNDFKCVIEVHSKLY